MRTTTIEAGKERGLDFKCPQPFLDPDLRVVVIGNRAFPLENVDHYERAKMALSDEKLEAAAVAAKVREKLAKK
jgi:hypothetical protein